MGKSTLAAVLVGLLAEAVVAQDPPEAARTWCSDQDPRNKCPGADCVCTDDSLEVTFDGGSDSVLEIGDFQPGRKVTTALVMETKSEGVQGWSYGVRHDQGFLTLLGRHTVALAEYTLDADPGEDGTLIQVTNRLKKKSTPPASINITVGSRSRAPRGLVDGWVKRAPVGPGVAFHRGDADGDGAVAVTDAVRVLLHLHAGGEAPGCLEAADFDDGGAVDTADAVALLEWLFRGGSGPPQPGPPRLPCGVDPPGSPALGCESYAGC